LLAQCQTAKRPEKRALFEPIPLNKQPPFLSVRRVNVKVKDRQDMANVGTICSTLPDLSAAGDQQ
jgi:hypothetical protein